MVGTYFIIPNDHPDANGWITGVVSGLAKIGLGPHDLPVADEKALARRNGDYPIHDLNEKDEILLKSDDAFVFIDGVLRVDNVDIHGIYGKPGG